MTSFWKITLIIIVAVVLLVAGFFGYQYYKNYNQPHVSAMHAITLKTALFAKIHDPRMWLSGLSHEAEWWQALTEIPSFQKFEEQSTKFDSVLSTDSWLSEILELQKFYISIDNVSEGKFAPIYLVELPNGHGKSGIESFVNRVYAIQTFQSQHAFEGATITSLLIPELSQELHYSIYKGLFIGSFELPLVEQAIDQINSGTPVNLNKRFKRIEATAGKNVDANIFINYSSFGQLISSFTGNKNLPFVSSLANLGFWSETDLIIKNDELLFNGYTITADSLNHLENYKTNPLPVSVPEVLPYTVAWMLDLGIGDLQKFHARRKSIFGVDPSDYDEYLSDLKAQYKIDLNKEIYPWAGYEIALAEICVNQQKKNCNVAVFHTKDVLKASISLESISRRINKVKGKKAFTLNHGEYTIKKLNHPEFLTFLFGPIFSSVKENYYIAIRDYIVFANNPDALIYLIDNFYNRKTLSTDLNYVSFSNNISDNSNIYLYLNIRKTSDLASQFMEEKYAGFISNNKDVLQKFEGLAIQFSYINQMFYTNIYLKYNPGYKEVSPLTWEYELEANLYQKPYLITNHRNKKLNVIAFDESSNIYLIDELGFEKWKLPLIEKPMSEIFLVDYYKNGKFQYLFNTENYLYLVDLNGNYVADFPVKLLASATGPLNVFDYNDDKEYRIVIPLNDNKIYNFDINNKPIEGWHKIQSKATVNSKVEHLVIKNKDYLFTTDENGNVIITNRRGEIRVEMKKAFNKSANAIFYENKTNNKGLFITTDDNGKLVYISEKGKLQRTDFGKFTADHYFLYEDFDQNGSEDFIFLDDNKLVVFDRLKNELLHHEFPEPISQKPILFKHMGNTYLGVILTASNEIQIFNKNGRVFSGQDIIGDTPFASGSLNADNKLNLITGKGNKIINLQLN